MAYGKLYLKFKVWQYRSWQKVPNNCSSCLNVLASLRVAKKNVTEYYPLSNVSPCEIAKPSVFQPFKRVKSHDGWDGNSTPISKVRYSTCHELTTLKRMESKGWRPGHRTPHCDPGEGWGNGRNPKKQMQDAQGSTFKNKKNLPSPGVPRGRHEPWGLPINRFLPFAVSVHCVLACQLGSLHWPPTPWEVNTEPACLSQILFPSDRLSPSSSLIHWGFWQLGGGKIVKCRGILKNRSEDP